MDFKGAKQYILARLKRDLSPDLYYHGLHHTWDVYNAACLIAELEDISDHDFDLVRTAALYHDSGFLFQYRHNEPIAVQLCEDILPKFGYSKDDIQKIGKIIMATRIEFRATTHLEQIMCDADYDYFGRRDYHEIAATLRREMEAQGKIITDLEWMNMQLNFLEGHHYYYTESSKNLRLARKKRNIEEIKLIKQEISEGSV